MLPGAIDHLFVWPIKRLMLRIIWHAANTSDKDSLCGLCGCVEARTSATEPPEIRHRVRERH